MKYVIPLEVHRRYMPSGRKEAHTLFLSSKNKIPHQTLSTLWILRVLCA